MGENTPAKTETKGNSQPWSEATPLLKSLIGQYGGMSTAVTPEQQAAMSNLTGAASGIQNFGATGAAGVNKLFGTDTTGQVGMLNTGYENLNKNLGNTASGAELDPYSTPGFSDAINTMTGDITKNVKGVYAASGRDPSGAGSFGQSLGRGLTQGIAPVIQSQFNTNKSNQMGAAKSLYDASGTTAGNITQQGQVPLQNILQGLQGAGMIPGLTMAPATAQVGAANAQYGQPFQNLQQLLTPALGLGALGTEQQGTSTSTPANNPMMNIMGGIMGGAGLMFSDERLKENIKDVGMLFDGTPVKEYNYVGDDTPQLGMIAQDIEKHNPEAGAVVEIAGYKAVNYRKATERAAKIGQRVGMLEEAA
jgi:Chaperone of endosialidase